MFCPTAFRLLMDTNYIYSIVYKDDNYTYVLLCEWDVCYEPRDLVHELAKKYSMRYLRSVFLSQFSDGANEYYKIKGYDKLDTSKAEYLTTLIVDKKDLAVTDVFIQLKDPNKKFIAKTLLRKTPIKSLYHNKNIKRIHYCKVNGKYLLNSFTYDEDEFITFRDSYVGKGMPKFLNYRQQKVCQRQGFTNIPQNTDSNLCFEGVKIIDDCYSTPYFTQYDTITQDTVRYGKDWKKGYIIPQLDLNY